MIAGNTGQDPEVRTTDSGMKIAKISIAVNEYRKNENGEKQEETTWFNVVAFGKLADLVESYVKKGSKLLVIGRLKKKQYTDQEGNERLFVETIADEIEFLSPKNQTEPKFTEAEAATDYNDNQQRLIQEEQDDLPF